MKNKGKTLCAALLLGSSVALNAQSVDEGKKDNFLKRAFRDMKESAKLQCQIDKANYQAIKLENKAFFQEQKRLSKPSVRTAEMRKEQQKELEAANKRVEEAKAKLEAVKEYMGLAENIAQYPNTSNSQNRIAITIGHIVSFASS